MIEKQQLFLEQDPKYEYKIEKRAMQRIQNTGGQANGNGCNKQQIMQQKYMRGQIISKLFGVTQKQLNEQINTLIGSIRDPEKPSTLAQLQVVQQDSVTIEMPSLCQNQNIGISFVMVKIVIKPTVPHCHLTHQIGLAIRMKLSQQIPPQWLKRMKIVIKCKPNSHNLAEQVQKQINDRERIAGALENEDVVKFIKQLI